MTDAELVARAQRDPSAFGDIYERYQQRVFAFCYRRVGHRQDAEDVAMQTFLNAFQALPRYQERGVPFLAFLFRIANNVATRHHTRRAREIPAEINDTGTEPDPSGIVLRRETAIELLRLIDQLPARQRTALMLCYVIGFRGQDAAAELGTTEGAMKQILLRGRQNLRVMIEEAA